jgi:hypothetical protein
VTEIAKADGIGLLQSATAVVQSAVQIMKLDSRDYALRALFLTAGGVAALLLALKGYGTALPAVALGGAIGAFFAARVQPSQE